MDALIPGVRASVLRSSADADPLGEPVAAPSANTLLGRLAAMLFGTATAFGVAGVAFTSADQSSAAAAITDAPGAGLKLVVDKLIIGAGATAQTISLTEETSGTLLARIHVAANTTYEFTFKGRELKLATAVKKLMLQSSASGAVSATAFYHFEA